MGSEAEGVTISSCPSLAWPTISPVALAGAGVPARRTARLDDLLQSRTTLIRHPSRPNGR